MDSTQSMWVGLGWTFCNPPLGVSTQPNDPLNLPETDRPPPEPINPIVAGGSPPTGPDPFGSIGEFPPQKPKPPDPTIKSKNSDKIQRFSNKELLEIHYNPSNLTIFFIFRRRATWNPPNPMRSDEISSRSSPDSTDSAKYQPDLDWSSEISASATKYRHQLQNPKPTNNLPETDGLEPDDPTIKTGRFRFWFSPTRKLRSGRVQVGHKADPVRPVDTPTHHDGLGQKFTSTWPMHIIDKWK